MADRLRLVLASFLMLFVELVLIRWAGANVVYLSYFSNFVLLGSFLGIGVGFLRGRSDPDLFRWAPLVMTVFVAFVLLFPVAIDRSGSGVIYFGSISERGLPIWLMLPVIFLTVAAIMACIAQGVARLFARFEPLEAYRLDIVGSLCGIALFSLLSFLGAGPAIWSLVIGAILLTLLPWRRDPPAGVATVGVCVLLALSSLGAGVSWSPYYRIETSPLLAEEGVRGYAISVNGIPHQSVFPAEFRQRAEPTYAQPYERTDGRPAGSVLIVGAGSGSDVAIALAHGASHVDAVEIDPVLYDLILFALPDSLTLVSGQSALRLESYLFSREAIIAAADHLAPGGAFGMYNYYREEWLVDRLAGTLEEVFDRAPCIDTSTFLAGNGVGRFSLLMAASDAGAVTCRTTWDPMDRVVPSPATDDHPFVYLRTRTIPDLYLVALAFVLLASLALVRVAGGPVRRMRPHLDLFFMGAAFLLLETKNVVQFALLFGTTWFVNELVFGGILLTVLAAVEVARRMRLRRRSLWWLALFLTITIAWLVPAASLLHFAVVPRFLAATTLAFAPVFLANLLFAERFREAGEATVAFGANLLGAMAGGVLEYLSLVVGFRALLLVAAGLYALAFLTAPRTTIASEAGGVTHERVPV